MTAVGDLSPFLKGYLSEAMADGTDRKGMSLLTHYSLDNISEPSMVYIRNMCADFVEKHWKRVAQVPADEQAGICFFNAQYGYFSGGFKVHKELKPKAQEQLQAEARKLGKHLLYEESGVIHVQAPRVFDQVAPFDVRIREGLQLAAYRKRQSQNVPKIGGPTEAEVAEVNTSGSLFGPELDEALNKITSAFVGVPRMPEVKAEGTVTGRFSSMGPNLSNVLRPDSHLQQVADLRMKEESAKIKNELFGETYGLDRVGIHGIDWGTEDKTEVSMFAAKTRTKEQKEDSLREAYGHGVTSINRDGKKVKLVYADRRSMVEKERERFRVAADVIVSAMQQPWMVSQLFPQMPSIIQDRIRLAKRYAALEHLAHLEGWFVCWTYTAGGRHSARLCERTGNALARAENVIHGRIDPLNRRLVEAGLAYQAFHLLGGTEEQLDYLIETYK